VKDRDAARPLLWNLKRAFPAVKLAWAGGYAGKLITWAASKLKPKLTPSLSRHIWRGCAGACSYLAGWRSLGISGLVTGTTVMR
jgi:hypothetical protein